MAIEKITMPQLGESVTEGTITNWLVKPGDQVNKYDPIAEVMTDKVNAEIPSSFTGVIQQLTAEIGETHAVGETICTIETEDAGAPTIIQEVKTPEAPTLQPSQQAGKNRFSPAVLKMSQEHGIDLSKVTGSGKEGRITRKDLQKLIDAGQTSNMPVGSTNEQVSSPQPVMENQAPNNQSPKLTMSGDLEIPVHGIRKAIASKMVQSKQEIPHAWTMMEVDVTDLVQYRDSIKTEFIQREGYNLTYFAFFVKAVAQALKEFPMMNSMWAGDKIIQKKDINISIAISTEDALYVPVIKHADEKSIKGIAREITELATKVRNGSLTTDDMQGGTFTVNNPGSFGSVQSMGIINYPQAAILQVESIVKRPVVMHNSMIAVRDMCNLCLSLDHRVLDGLVCGRFLHRVKEILENVSKETTAVY
ncbi:dihydrolipoamide acetyltransferase family protein [Bacillus sp. FJAT-50079]|uniref:dihydrolipoamide acetyltransferase family protein n=1 Tax=Bacillus sp. FJAT-50079 TaxID=2833577 RepID=UPI001BCA4516|nr:dihydrolipoamide acetyltransferase family protein [Bacillus sp. FJAT-50079]MBS4209661.1 2-oxo acid dehydrogenase subunit E2 [Bacillus sp. FJAT-50079]